VKWSSHKLITLKILSMINYSFDKNFLKGLFQGVVEPDKLLDFIKGERLVPVKQHDGINYTLVKYYLHLALYFYRKGDTYSSGRALGRALHYVQDGVIKRRRWLRDVHEDIENSIDFLVRNELQNIINNCIKVKVKVSSNPREALCSAVAESYNVLSWFIHELENPLDARKLLRRLKTIKFLKYTVSTFLACLLLAIYATYLVSAFPLTPIIIVAIIVTSLYKPKTYWNAFKMGLIKIKLLTYRTAM